MALPATRSEALLAGAPFYFTGTFCRNAHADNRYSSTGECVTCVSQRAKDQRTADPDAAKARKNAHYAANIPYQEKARARSLKRTRANPEENRRKVSAWKIENREHCNDLSRLAYPRHKESISAKAAARYAADPAKNLAAVMAWRTANPEKFRATCSNIRAKRNSAEGTHTGREIKALFLTQEGKCAYFSACGRYLADGWHPDHKIPLSKGGSNWISNIQLCCIPCNLSKSSKDPEVWAKRIGFICG